MSCNIVAKFLRSPRALAAATASLAITTHAGAARSFSEIFFVSVDTSSDGSTRVDWVGTSLIWLLILMSVASVALIVMAWSGNRPAHIMPRAVANQARHLIAEGKFAEALSTMQASRSDFARVLHAALAASPGGYEAMIRSAEQTSDDLILRRFRRIEVLNVLGQVSPMLGLFGTVYGVIVAFMTIASMGGAADPTALAGGIGTALVATFWGLLIAIPALSAYALVRNTVDASSSEAAREVDAILARFRPSVTGTTP
jgi:biopolymer transport protein ExbB